MRLFIAEKPSLARAIADGLGVVRKDKASVACRDGSVVTWCFGHLLEQAEPDAYLPDDIPKTRKGGKVWRMEDLPIFPERWKMRARGDASAKAQLAAIGRLLKTADTVVNAGDPDREGQLLVDEVLEHFRNRKPVDRFWASAIDPASVRKALSSLRPNAQYAGMRDAARGRSHADWLLGMNLSRLYTLREQARGERFLVIAGRVQTPTLTLVARRDYAVRNFRPVAYLNILADCSGAGKDFTAKWTPRPGQEGLDKEGKLLVDLALGQRLAARLAGCKTGRTVSCEKGKKRQAQPKGYSLAGLQQDASRLYGFTAEQTLNTAQRLYETHKCASYPRTDCEYLPMAQFGDAADVLRAISQTIPRAEGICAKADPTIRSAIWDDRKVTAHHAIIPTAFPADWSRLSADERKIYGLVAKRYLAQFFPPYEYLASKIVLDIGGETFTATGNVPVSLGWKVLYRKQERADREKEAAKAGAAEREERAMADQDLPDLAPGSLVDVRGVRGVQAQTKPPAYYTEGTLIAAMESIHRAYDDPAIKARLKEADGIGTPATRAGIIGELKRRGFLVAEGKKLHCSPEGREMLLKVSPRMRSAVLTAQYEGMLKDVEAGRMPMADFEAQVKDFVRAEILACRGR